MRLPEKFQAEMDRLWSEYAPEGSLTDFLAVHDQSSASGLRANLLKTTPTELKRLLSDLVQDTVPWSDSGFYTREKTSPGRLPHYHAGLFYIQEPSAMLPAEALDVKPGDIVLDLCAAPGGKSTRLAAGIGPGGLLWANEINGDRVKALLRNLELAGAGRTIITQDTPERLAERLPGFFDRILVDAPCSGSGMFRRDPQATASWERYGPATCTPVQSDILEAADRMLKPGGYLVYSTCSFSVSEDEAMILSFQKRHPCYKIAPIPQSRGLSPGLSLAPGLEQTVRIWPHLTRGDGHYCALLQKSLDAKPYQISAAKQSLPDEQIQSSRKKRKNPALETRQAVLGDGAIQACFREWAQATLSVTGLEKLDQMEQSAFYRIHQDRLHLMPSQAEDLEGLHFVKTGLYLGQVHNRRSNNDRTKTTGLPIARSAAKLVFEPAHALVLALEANDFQYALRLDAADPLLQKYLRGETLEWPQSLWPAAGWTQGAYVAVCLERFPLGWAKAQNQGMLKNLYPPGWRKMT
ncbi:MAG: RsmB/NOP family class I SAM-dependent RNA methyltransferase [Eubacteriales bacterium]|nr:RsmB/NOP family class I SAM-dependent RNA methyltransferase [Eubacteriales bacterium]